jgi:hypothetical protein
MANTDRSDVAKSNTDWGKMATRAAGRYGDSSTSDLSPFSSDLSPFSTFVY